jgi:aconitate hydratase
MTVTGHDTLKTRQSLNVDGQNYDYFSLKAVEKECGDLSRLPYCLKVLLENLLRFEDGKSVKVDDIKAMAIWLKDKKYPREIAYRPARVLMQDFTGVPAVVDLAAMRDAMVSLGGDPDTINPKSAVDLVIDHSVMVDAFGTAQSFQANVEREFERNGERYAFLRWGQSAFNNFRVVPPGTGICHQVNLEYLGQTVWTDEDENNPGTQIAYPDTLVGTDSHTTMINGLSVLGWGVGGIEAEAAMLGQPVSMLIPEVVGFKLTGSMPEGATATDLVLTVTQMLRAKGVVGKFVEFYGEGLNHMSLADRATISNMAPEYGATCGFFPIDQETLRYLRFTGREEHRINLVEAYAKEQDLWRDDQSPEPVFTETLELELGDVMPSISGPKRPQDKILLSDAKHAFEKHIHESGEDINAAVPVKDTDYELTTGDVVIAAITSCTNTSNPDVMIAAGLIARNALAKGLAVKPWVKTSLAPGSQVVTDYLEKAGLQDDLDSLGFNLVGYGCTTCIGNSGPLDPAIENAIREKDLTVCGVLSGNRNFEGRIHQNVQANYLASPPLVVCYALAGSMQIDLLTQPLGQDQDGNDIYMKDVWPTNAQIREMVDMAVTPDMFRDRYSNVFEGPKEWQAVKTSGGKTYDWDMTSTYVQNPPYFENISLQIDAPQDITRARALAIMGDSVTTDHISPAGAIKADSPAGAYLQSHQVALRDFNSYGSRRGNHEVMMRGTFANIRIRNEMVPDIEGGVTKHIPSGEQMPIYDAAMSYINDNIPLIVVAGKEYGTGSSRDWAAKGTRLLGVKAVITESFERIHRSNLLGMGVLPLVFKDGQTRESLGLKGDEEFDISGIANIEPGCDPDLTIHYPDGSEKLTKLKCRIDTLDELEYYRHGGILHYVLRSMAKSQQENAA